MSQHPATQRVDRTVFTARAPINGFREQSPRRRADSRDARTGHTGFAVKRRQWIQPADYHRPERRERQKAEQCAPCQRQSGQCERTHGWDLPNPRSQPNHSRKPINARVAKPAVISVMMHLQRVFGMSASVRRSRTPEKRIRTNEKPRAAPALQNADSVKLCARLVFGARPLRLRSWW